MIDQILPGLYRITLPMPFRLGHVHVHALPHPGGVALFDVGMSIPESFRALGEALATLGRTIEDVDQVFLTHFHVDHCGVAGEVQRRSGAEVLMSARDEQRINNEIKPGEFVRRAVDFYSRHDLPRKTVDALIKLLAVFRKATVPFRVKRPLEPHDRYQFGDRLLEIIPAPGHTRGQMCFYFPEDGILLSGDHVLPEITPNLSPDIFDPDYRPLGSFLASLESIRDLPVRMVYPAHGAPFPDLAKRVDEIRNHHAERTRLILEALRGGEKTTFKVSQDIFGKNLPDFDEYLALNETYVHLVDLEDKGIVESGERDGLVLYRVR
ncbi:MAG TPA: MBL fold metallo-hydrolase [Syntrophales bacterium]|nr:MBL fold metallo-hydrolase [Syntrophales bacterium]HQN78283.1 MBL fold metallo-hydrolase [Syntrophales bacterium]HQQ27913.1 MBL fold metallo-hydrolase [Syntrophales bacterium]